MPPEGGYPDCASRISTRSRRGVSGFSLRMSRYSAIASVFFPASPRTRASPNSRLALHVRLSDRSGVAVRRCGGGQVPSRFEGTCDPLPEEIFHDPGLFSGGDPRPEVCDREIVVAARKRDASEVVQGVQGGSRVRMRADVPLEKLLDGRQLRRVRRGRDLQQLLRPVQGRPEIPGGLVLLPLQVRPGPEHKCQDGDDADRPRGELRSILLAPIDGSPERGNEFVGSLQVPAAEAGLLCHRCGLSLVVR